MEQLGRRITGSEVFWTGIGLILMLAACGGIAAGLLQVSVMPIVALVVALLAAAVVIAYPFIGVLIFIAFLYLWPEKYDEGAWVERLTVAIGALTLFAWLIQFLRRRETFQWRAELGWMGGVAASIVLSSYQIPGFDSTYYAFIDAAKLICLFFLLVQLLNTERRLDIALHCYVVIMATLAVIAAYGYFTRTSVMMEHGTPRAIVPWGSFVEPNYLAAALVTAVPLALRLLGRGRPAPTRLWGAIAFFLVVFGIYLTNSRGGMLALAATFGVCMVHRLGWVRGVLMGVALLGLLFTFGPDRFSPDTVSGEDDSAQWRIQAWQAGLDMFAESPYFGVGYDTFQFRHRLTAHNSFVLVLAEVGAFGTIAWVGLLYWAVLRLVRLRRVEQEEQAQQEQREQREQREGGAPPAERSGDALRGYAPALLAGIMGWLTASMFLSLSFRPYSFVFIGFVAALAMLKREHLVKARNWPHYVMVLLVFLGGVALMHFVVENRL